MLTTACTNKVALVMKASLARQRLLDRKRPLLDAKLTLFGKRDHRLARAAGKIALEFCRVTNTSSWVRMKADDDRLRSPCRSRSSRPRRRRFCGSLLGEHLCQQRHALDVAPSHRISGTVITAIPVLADFAFTMSLTEVTSPASA